MYRDFAILNFLNISVLQGVMSVLRPGALNRYAAHVNYDPKS